MSEDLPNLTGGGSNKKDKEDIKKIFIRKFKSLYRAAFAIPIIFFIAWFALMLITECSNLIPK